MSDIHYCSTPLTTKKLTLDFAKNGLATLHPAYFALVMATGIVSLDCNQFGLTHFAWLLFWLNIPAYCVLILLYAARAAWFPDKFVADCFSHKRAFGFFSIVAATNVLGSQWLTMAHNAGIAQALWWVALFFWMICTYSIFVFLIISKNKPEIHEGVNGGWLIAVVATQSICVLGAQLNPNLLGTAQTTGLFLLSCWLFGGMLYLWLISMIFYRYMFFKFEPSDLIPPYWINMGAMAISTLAGAQLGAHYGNVQPVSEVMPFVKGVSILYWATATWWIPMLLVLGVWRHGIRKLHFKYDPLYWGLVFPLGMYSVCSLKLSTMLNVPAIMLVARVFLVCALLGWTMTFLSMAQRPLFVLFVSARKVFGKCGGKNHAE
jgi:tellurite resistance protein TehA-like permease